MSTGDTDGAGVAADMLARDAVRLVAAASSPTTPAHTIRAAVQTRELIESQLDDLDEVELLADFDEDPTGTQARSVLIGAIAGCALDDPDFARKLLVAVNSDCLVTSPPTTTDPGEGLPDAGGPGFGDLAESGVLPVRPLLRLAGGVVAVVVGVWMRMHYGPVDDACSTGIGALAQMANGGAYRECQMAAVGAPASWWIIAAGLIFAGEGIWRLATQPRR